MKALIERLVKKLVKPQKAVIKVKYLANVPKLKVNPKGDWIDLYAAREVTLGLYGPIENIPLGVAIKLPDGYEALIVSRSSAPKVMNLWSPISVGVIDNTYCGNEDEWKWPVAPFGTRTPTVAKHWRVCQFRIQLSQHATWKQRVKWLFTDGVELLEVDDLKSESRGGFGTSGK